MSNGFTGMPLDRVDGPLKVKGEAKYAAEFSVPNLAYGALVQSSIAKGRIAKMEVEAAKNAEGVVLVLTPDNLPQMSKLSTPPQGQNRPILENDIAYSGQTIAVVVADSWEQAEYAAQLIKIEYESENPSITIADRLDQSFSPQGGEAHYARGDYAAGLTSAVRRIEESYRTAVEHHNPMEPHATIAFWPTPDQLHVYDATQGVVNTQGTLAAAFGLQRGQVRVQSPFLGGGFGCKGQSWPHVRLAALAAREAKRAVKIVLTRRQMFSSNGHRSNTIQANTFATNQAGKLVALQHQMHGHTAIHGNFLESTGLIYGKLYSCPNVEIDHKLIRCNVGVPTYMRAPGEASGSFGLETAMDEMAISLNMDPLEFRLLNYSEIDESEGKPWSSKKLRECYQEGAERFGWGTRTAEPGSMRNGHWLVGYGMSTASYPANYWNAACWAGMDAQGNVTIRICTQDIGTGTYTILSQVAADAIGVPFTKVKVEIGDTEYPPGPLSAGSNTATTAGSAVMLAGEALRDEILELLIADPNTPFYGVTKQDITAKDGLVMLNSGKGKSMTYPQILARYGKASMEKQISAGTGMGPPAGSGPPEIKWGFEGYSKQGFGAQFCEVHVDPDLRMIKVARWVGAFALGKVLNEKTLKSQLIGGIVWGIGMGLLEETLPDAAYGRYVNTNLAEYHVPVNKDVPNIQIILVDEVDPHVSPIGAKGAGEIGITGAAAAIGNAVYNATGKRVRDLPITLDKIL